MVKDHKSKIAGWRPHKRGKSPEVRAESKVRSWVRSRRSTRYDVRGRKLKIRPEVGSKPGLEVELDVKPEVAGQRP